MYTLTAEQVAACQQVTLRQWEQCLVDDISATFSWQSDQLGPLRVKEMIHEVLNDSSIYYVTSRRGQYRAAYLSIMCGQNVFRAPTITKLLTLPGITAEYGLEVLAEQLPKALREHEAGAYKQGLAN